jgi:hypothetical protein
MEQDCIGISGEFALFDYRYHDVRRLIEQLETDMEACGQWDFDLNQPKGEPQASQTDAEYRKGLAVAKT